MIEMLASLFSARGRQTQCEQRRVLQRQMLCETERFLDRHLRGYDAMQTAPLMACRKSVGCDRPCP
jgi:hypothetical protein